VKALEELQAQDVGSFIFRPSSNGPDNITLTWKFYHNNIVHINIQESEKPVGASIGNKLRISDDVFDNLQEIVERYIQPCNKLLREVVNHPKFLSCNNEEELAAALKQEKADDAQRIPYRFCVLETYP
jgi:transcription elongation factor SPT6